MWVPEMRFMHSSGSAVMEVGDGKYPKIKNTISLLKLTKKMYINFKIADQF